MSEADKRCNGRNKSHTTAFKLRAVELANTLNSMRLAARQLNVDEKCIRNWKAQYAQLVAAYPDVRRLRRKCDAPYQDLEERLYAEICDLQHRDQQTRRITRPWIIKRFSELVQEEHQATGGECTTIYVHYSSYTRWYTNFLKRKNISLIKRKLSNRHATGQHLQQHRRLLTTPELWVQFAHFHRFIRNLAQRPRDDRTERDVGIYSLQAIGHFRSIPIDFGNGASKIASFGKPINSVSKAEKEEEAGGGFTATFVPFVCADGSNTRVKPVIIFKGSACDQNLISPSERFAYDRRVVVRFNIDAEIDDDIVANIIDMFRRETVGEPARLVIFDSSVMQQQLTQQVSETCAENNVDYAVVPVGCSQYLQPLEQRGGIVEEWMAKLQQAFEQLNFSQLSIQQRRIHLTNLIANTWFSVVNSKEGKEQIRRSFVTTGIAVKPDGSEDNLIEIDGHADYSVAAALQLSLHTNNNNKVKRKSRNPCKNNIPAKDAADISDAELITTAVEPSNSTVHSEQTDLYAELDAYDDDNL